ncbi:hypothetical protein [Saccharothrix lopnurensis]|uniref:Uncharacterized protein n=1 Tax=Saccharothrix lopnurensis TaxID=1670621 RepID=A0ABW1P1F4_9PSEU
MAVPDAVRRSGSLLVRALTVGGLATAAWLVCAGSAAAEDHPGDVADLLAAPDLHSPGAYSPGAHSPAADFAFGTDFPSTAADLGFDERRAQADALLHAAVPAHGSAGIFEIPPLFFVPQLVVPQPVEQPAGVSQVLANEAFFADTPFADDPFTDEGQSYSGSTHSTYSHSGSATNTMPAPMYEAKVAAKAAARAAAEATPASPIEDPPPTPPATPTADPAPWAITTTFSTAAPDAQSTRTAEVTWEAPEHNVPAPAPKQAPAPSAPTASSSSADNGGGHRGGLIASLTGQSGVERTTAWSVERRDDGRSPGSVPGLPSTSPD